MIALAALIVEAAVGYPRRWWHPVMGVGALIAAAGRALGMSYRRAWLLIEAMNRGFGQAVVEAQAGGKAGGGSVLTALGRSVVECYRAAERAAADAIAPQIAALEKQIRAP